ncbi:MAG: hypothetical protein NZ843_06465 [Fimbriimonadales bacterium]|nr:hypothetical protein [Fimbriimonadales bacterium]
MRRLGLAFAATVVLAAWTLPAFAQYGEETVGNNFRVRIGAFFPSKSAARDYQSTWLNVGLDYVIQRGTPTEEGGLGADFGISLDYYGAKSASNFPLLANLWGTLPGSALSFNLGVGVGFARDYDEREDKWKNKTGFAFTIGLEYNFATGAEGTTPLLLGASFKGLSGFDEVYNGFTVYVGARF